MRMKSIGAGKSRRGFTLIEMLVVLFVIILIMMIGLRSYDQFLSRARDKQRMTELNRFAKQLELYRNQLGVYPCGSGDSYNCPGWSDLPYETACTDKVPGTILTNTYGANGPLESFAGNDTNEIQTFLNGGQCCIGKSNQAGIDPYPTPTSTNPVAACDKEHTCDDSAWGLYRWGYLGAADIRDPLNTVINGKGYYYCYSVNGAGRHEYALYARMENNSLNANDGGVQSNWYEIYSPGYSRPNLADPDHSGWGPWNWPHTGETVWN